MLVGKEIQLASEEAATPLAAVETPSAKDTKLDAWLIWLIAIVAIVLPVIALACVSSIPAGRFDFDDVSTAVDRGDFLIPVLIMHAETVRRWTREVACPDRYWRAGRILACTLSSLAACVCFAATVITAVDPVTGASSRSVEGITFAALAGALVFGSAAVIARAE